MSHAGFIVPPRKKDDIIKAATYVRSCFSTLITDQGRLPIDVVYELLPDLLPGFVLEVCEESEMGSDHGRAYPNQNLIKLRKDIYDGMCRGQGRDRFTGAHELGHLFLHRNVHFARAMTSTTKIYCDSEWQANTFASALLIDDVNLARCRSVTEVAQRFAVSLQAAQVRYRT